LTVKGWFLLSRALTNKAASLDGLRNYTGAILYSDKALAVDPLDVDAFNSKGIALYGSGNYAGAITYYDKVMAIQPNNYMALNNKGLALAQEEKNTSNMTAAPSNATAPSSNMTAATSAGMKWWW
jgi:tetratricopeptide (TPR) repeat protein